MLAVTLAQVGWIVATWLQPSSLSEGQPERVGATASFVQVKVTRQGAEVLALTSRAVTVKVWLFWQPLVWIAPAEQSMTGAGSQRSLALNKLCTAAQLGKVGLQVRA